MNDISPRLISRLLELRRQHHFPSRVKPAVQSFALRALGLLFPHHAAESDCSPRAVMEDAIQLREELSRLVRAVTTAESSVPADLPDRFLATLPELLELLLDDAQAILDGDPAAHSRDEVVLAYPGFFATAVQRIAHALYELSLPLVPRLLTEFAHERTGIDLHPGARIGRRFCIDHGTGVVVGETTVIGDGVKLYQGVTLGALTVQKALSGRKRHPTIEDGVVVYAGATILGGDTVVGRGSIVAGNAFVTRSVPPDSIVGRSGEVRTRGGVSPDWLDFVI